MGSPSGSHVSNRVRAGFGRAWSVAADRTVIWGECLSSDRTGAYVHELALATSSRDLVSESGELSHAGSSGLSRVPGDRNTAYSDCDEPAHSVAMRLGPVCSRCLEQTPCNRGLLAASNWLKPVTRGGWRAAAPFTMEGLADVS